MVGKQQHRSKEQKASDSDARSDVVSKHCVGTSPDGDAPVMLQL